MQKASEELWLFREFSVEQIRKRRKVCKSREKQAQQPRWIVLVFFSKLLPFPSQMGKHVGNAVAVMWMLDRDMTVSMELVAVL